MSRGWRVLPVWPIWSPSSGELIRHLTARFTAAAAELGLLRPGDKLDQNVVDLCLRVVDMAASIGDRYGDDDFGNAGEHIRAEIHT